MCEGRSAAEEGREGRRHDEGFERKTDAGSCDAGGFLDSASVIAD